MLMSFIVSSDDSHCKIFEGLFCKAATLFFSSKSNAKQKHFPSSITDLRDLCLHFMEFHCNYCKSCHLPLKVL